MNTAADCLNLIHNYIAHLNEGFSAVEYLEIGCQIITPYLRPDGHYIEVFSFVEDGNLILSDEGQTSDWLFSLGLEIEGSESRKALVEQLAHRYGLSFEKSILTMPLSSDNAGENIHRFITALTAISQLTLFRKQRGKQTFKEDVEIYLAENEQKYQTNFTIKGKSTIHKVDFHLDSGRNILLEAVTATSVQIARNQMVSLVFKWVDIREEDSGYKRFVLIDDSDDKYKYWDREKIMTPLETYSDSIIRWSNRVQLLAPLIK